MNSIKIGQIYSKIDQIYIEIAIVDPILSLELDHNQQSNLDGLKLSTICFWRPKCISLIHISWVAGRGGVNTAEICFNLQQFSFIIQRKDKLKRAFSSALYC